MQLRIDRSSLQKEAEALHLSDDKLFYEGSEWLETSGLGGWAGSSMIGCNTRRYHGLLVAATKPPTERMVLLSKRRVTQDMHLYTAVIRSIYPCDNVCTGIYGIRRIERKRESGKNHT